MEVTQICLKFFLDGLERAGFKAELDGQDVIDVQMVHASFVVEFGLAGVDVAQLHRVDEVNVHVVVVLLLVILDQVGDAAEDVLLGDRVGKPDEVVVQERSRQKLGSCPAKNWWISRHRSGVVRLPKYNGYVVLSMCCSAMAISLRREPMHVLA